MAQEIKKAGAPTMPPTRYVNPFAEMPSRWTACSIHSLAAALAGSTRLLGLRGATSCVPSIDVRETDTDLVVEAELPGMDEKDVSVTLSNDVLTLKGEKKSEREEKKEDYHLMERSYGSFQRSFRLGDTIDPDKVTAAFDKGVLKVTLAKRPEAVKTEKPIPIGKS